MDLPRDESSAAGIVRLNEQLNEVVAEIDVHVLNDEAHKVTKDQRKQVICLARKIIFVAGDYGETQPSE